MAGCQPAHETGPARAAHGWTAAALTALAMVATLHAIGHPGRVVSGQAVRFTGNLGARGKRRVHLQWHMNRTGDVGRRSEVR